MNIKNELEKTESDIRKGAESVNALIADENAVRDGINDLTLRARNLGEELGVDTRHLQLLPNYNPNYDIDEIDLMLDGIIITGKNKHGKFPKLSSVDVIISCTAGIVAVAIDVFLVGTPEVTKIYRGGEIFDGSILTKAIRKLGDGKLGEMCKKLEKICKVPYDISVVKGGMNPNNHRLRSFSHDPFFGLFFALFDIIMNTTTFIDDSGCLRILPNTSYQSSTIEKILCVFYYIGHIVSDMFTARGIPIPGFFLTQFFTDGTGGSIAKIAEGMYLDGYDLRHFASMTAPVIVKDIIINLYLKLSEKAIDYSPSPLALREKDELDEKLKKEKMHFIANSIAVGGNVVKFFAPPYSCNPCSINAPEWFAFIKSGITMIRAQVRDYSPEEALENREDIDAMWRKLEVDLNTI